MNRKSTPISLLMLGLLGFILYGCQNDAANPTSAGTGYQSSTQALHKVTPIPDSVRVAVSGHSVTVTWAAAAGVGTYTAMIQDSVTADTIALLNQPATLLQAVFNNVPAGSYYATVIADAGYPSARAFFTISDSPVQAPVVTVHASRKYLWPPSGHMVRVKYGGTVTNSEGGASYKLTDEYGLIHYSGSLGAGGYLLKLKLQASRRGNDRDGRHYTFTVKATNSAGSDTESVVVLVPHDKRDCEHH